MRSRTWQSVACRALIVQAIAGCSVSTLSTDERNDSFNQSLCEGQPAIANTAKAMGSLVTGGAISPPSVWRLPYGEIQNGEGRWVGREFLVQWFENVRIEYHPEVSDSNHRVLLGRTGAEIIWHWAFAKQNNSDYAKVNEWLSPQSPIQKTYLDALVDCDTEPTRYGPSIEGSPFGVYYRLLTRYESADTSFGRQPDSTTFSHLEKMWRWGRPMSPFCKVAQNAVTATDTRALGTQLFERAQIDLLDTGEIRVAPSSKFIFNTMQAKGIFAEVSNCQTTLSTSVQQVAAAAPPWPAAPVAPAPVVPAPSPAPAPIPITTQLACDDASLSAIDDNVTMQRVDRLSAHSCYHINGAVPPESNLNRSHMGWFFTANSESRFEPSVFMQDLSYSGGRESGLFLVSSTNKGANLTFDGASAVALCSSGRSCDSETPAIERRYIVQSAFSTNWNVRSDGETVIVIEYLGNLQK